LAIIHTFETFCVLYASALLLVAASRGWRFFIFSSTGENAFCPDRSNAGRTEKARPGRLRLPKKLNRKDEGVPVAIRWRSWKYTPGAGNPFLRSEKISAAGETIGRKRLESMNALISHDRLNLETSCRYMPEACIPCREKGGPVFTPGKYSAWV
jgi:hypothetical protein